MYKYSGNSIQSILEIRLALDIINIVDRYDNDVGATTIDKHIFITGK